MSPEEIKIQLYALWLIANHEENTDPAIYEAGSIWIEELKTYFNPEDIASAALDKRYSIHLYNALKKRAEQKNSGR